MHTKLQSQLHQMLIDQIVSDTDEPHCILSFNLTRIAKHGTVYNAVTAHHCRVLPTWDLLGYPSPTHCDVIPDEVLQSQHDRRDLPRIAQHQAI